MLIAAEIHDTTSHEGNQRATGEEGVKVVAEQQTNMKILVRITNQKIEKRFKKVDSTPKP